MFVDETVGDCVGGLARIPLGIDYASVPGLSNELKGKLARVEPATIGQAERIPGMTQAAITALLVAMKKMEADGKEQGEGNQDPGTRSRRSE